MNHYLQNLNSEQYQAVTTTNGPLLVLAGAGTGKTKVLTSRIAHLLKENITHPDRILAVTFTNKAAREMVERIRNLLGATASPSWIGTFHSLSARMLRIYGKIIDINPNFVILDSDDQLRIIKQILNEYHLDLDNAKNYLYYIQKSKDKLSPISANNSNQIFIPRLEEVSTSYQRRLRSLSALDFGDLISEGVKLINHSENHHLIHQFTHLLVDEYQDTNTAQALWLKSLAKGAQNNLCAVGDDDQAIYGWRGAEIANILSFEKEYPGASIIRLEQNYRSTGHILAVATCVISQNESRHGKKLWTEDEDGHKVTINTYPSDNLEANEIIDKIEDLRRKENLNYSQFAILVRAGHQTRLFEEALLAEKIPYQIIGGMRFYDRAEIRDSLSYLRLLVANNDDLAFERIINTPRRGYGDKAAEEIRAHAIAHQQSLFSSLKELIEAKKIRGKLATHGQNLIDIIAKTSLIYQEKSTPINLLIRQYLINVGYFAYLEADRSEARTNRIDNVNEFIGSISQTADLIDFLNNISLESNIDQTQESILNQNGQVNIMTFHGAKGLEFDNVFLPGWEEGIFPSFRAISENGLEALEEERRLAYVAITRARSRLYISTTCSRRVFGQWQYPTPSRFIAELPSKHIRVEETSIIHQIATSDHNSQYHNQQHKTGFNQLVYHPKFGNGRVISGDKILTILFEDGTTKSIAKEYLSICS